MRLWHKDLIPFLPRQQLLGQGRECCCIAKNIAENGTPGHMLVNRIMDYPESHFYKYASMVANEMADRGYSVHFWRFKTWVDVPADQDLPDQYELFQDWHDQRYLRQCYYNLEEKYDCGGILEEEWFQLRHEFADKPF